MSPRSSFSTLSVPDFNIQLETEKMERPAPARMPSQSVPTTNQNSPNHSQSQVPPLNLAGAQHHALTKSKSMPGTSRELPAPTKFTFSSHDVSTMSKMTDNTSQIPHWREFPKPPIRILCRVELKAKLKLDNYKSTCHAQEYSQHKSTSYPTKPNMIFEPSPEQQYMQQYYDTHGYDSQDDSGSEYESSDEEEEEDDDDAYGYTYQAPSQQPSSKHFTFPMQHQQVALQQPQQPIQQSHQAYIPRPQQYDYQKSAPIRISQQQVYQQQQQQHQQARAIQNMEEKKRIIHRSSMKSVPMKQPPTQQPPSNQVVFTIHPQQHKYSQPDMKRGSFSQPSQQQPPQHQRSASHHQLEIRRNRSAPSIQSQTPPKHIIRKPTSTYYDSMEQQQQQQQQQQPPTNAYDLARNLWRKQRRSYQDMLSTLHHKLHMNGSSYTGTTFVSP